MAPTDNSGAGRGGNSSSMGGQDSACKATGNGERDWIGGDEQTHRQTYTELSLEILSAFEEVLQPPDGSAWSDRYLKGGGSGRPPPRFQLRRATCEVFRRRAQAPSTRPSVVDLKRLSLPEPGNALS
eukprot:TRINITY_DN16004_c1_g1_i3.p1 TRINITY_DN16004_c1_g1~~TRINITY_DN16004_c1_g1_i3.p1  ORF type:complete len:127 (+),score=16.34 TRINITY_DN16004_c1_g1_i3:114-494(+)